MVSLTSAERDATAREFEANLAQSGLSMEEFRQKTGLSEERFNSAFMLSSKDADPLDVWLIRDMLETAVKIKGGTLVPFSKLTDEARADATRWFGVGDLR